MNAPGPQGVATPVIRRAGLRFAILILVVAGLASLTALIGLSRARAFVEAAAGTGDMAPLLAIAVSGLLVLALVPRTVVAATAGLLFGPVAGAGYVLVGAATGAVVAFAAGRWLGRDFTATRQRLARIDGWLTGTGTVGVLIARLLPIAPFGLVSYAFGMSGVRLRAYLAGTLLGMTPSTVIYASLGANALSPGTGAFAALAAAAAVLSLASWFGATLMARRAPETATIGDRTMGD